MTNVSQSGPSPDDQRLISVIVPIFDVAPYVTQCIASLRAQTHKSMQVIMVDDGSRDDSAARAVAAAGDDPRFELITQDNAGLSAARNQGLARARGDFVAFVDSDDAVQPDFLSGLLQALDAHPDMPWAACAIRNRYPDLDSTLHSAIHDAADPCLAPGTQVFAFRSARDVIRHYPSAWNKLYRRAFIDDLRFAEGTWFEDHAFYLTLALRAPGIVHTADPLYDQSRGRVGQITETDSDRVFEQLEVLDNILPMLRDGPLPDGPAAAATLACRLLTERGTTLRDPERRARFVDKARDMLARHEITYVPDPAQGASLSWGIELDGVLPLSIVLPWDGRDAAPLKATLTALAGQHGPTFELLVMCNDAATVDQAHGLAGEHARILRAPDGTRGAAWAAGIDQANGKYVILLSPGDVPGPWALHDRVEAMLHHTAECGVSARRLRSDAEVQTGFEYGYTPAHDAAPSPFHVTPRQALAADLSVAGLTFDRAFLNLHGLRPASCTRHGAWSLALGALLLSDRSLYLPKSDVTLATIPYDKKYNLAQLIRDHRALCDAMPAVALFALPTGWERRLFARTLRHWLLDGPDRARPGQVLAQIGAAGAIAALGMGRTGQSWAAGFDATVGPKFARLFDTAGLLRLVRPVERARLAAGGALPGETRADLLDIHDLYPARPAHAFPLAGPGTRRGSARFLLNFARQETAAFSFYADNGRVIPLHIAVRPRDGLVICNDTRTDGLWRKERHRSLNVLDANLELTVEIDPADRRAAVRIWLNDALFWTLGAQSLLQRGGVTRLDTITHVELYGDVTVFDLHVDTAHAAPNLDERLQVRLPGPVTADATLTIDGQTEAVEILPPRTRFGDAVARANLPSRAWANIAEADALCLRYKRAGHADLILSLSRKDLAGRIAVLLRNGLPMGDADLILQIIEQVSLAGLVPYLDLGAQAELARLAQRFNLADQLPDLVHTPRHASDPFRTIMADLVARFRRGDRGAKLFENAPPDPLAQRHMLRALVEAAVLDGDMDSLFAVARDAGHLPFTRDAEDVWSVSAELPFLWHEGREADVLDALHRIAAARQGWCVTPALAWIGRQAQAEDPAISRDGCHAALGLVLDWLSHDGRNYWGRSACTALTDWIAGLVQDLERLPAPLGYRAMDTMIATYSLNPAFWHRLDAADALPPRLAMARAAFRDLQAAEDDSAREAALTRLQQLGASDVARARVEYLGPAGVAMAAGAALAPDALLPVAALGQDAVGLAALRHMAAPGTAPTTLETADIVSETVRRLTPEQDSAPLLPLQQQLHAQLVSLIQAPETVPDVLAGLLADLARLSDKQARYLGIGLAMTLLPHVVGAQEQRQIADWLIARDQNATGSEDDAELHDAYWRRRAPAVRMGLARLATSDLHDATRVVAHYAQMPDIAAQLKPEDWALPPLPDIPRTQAVSPPHPVNDVIVTVFSCHPYLDTRIPALREGWLSDLQAMGIPYVIVVGDGDGTLRGDVLHVDAPDDYEGLPAKTLATIDWVRRNTAHAHMFKIDDDCLVDAQNLFGDLEYRSCDYVGRRLHRAPGQMDRIWHQAKARSARGKLELDKSPEPSTYADGGSGYVLSRDAMEAACAAANSPEGRALIQTSFMEDKLLGDLLNLRGLYLSTPGYLTSIRRRTFSEATPVAYWNVGFHPSRAAPTHQVHMDTHLGQAEVRALRGKPQLAPRKIWPSFQEPRLGYQSNALELISAEHTVDRARAADVTVVAVMRNERFMAPHFLAHYRNLGVGGFLIADNVSDDGTREYLLEQDDVALFSVDTDYKLSHYGVAWQQAMLAAFRRGRWSLVADADELLFWQPEQRQNLSDLLHHPDFADADAARLFMLDMYPRGPLSDATFETGSPFEQAGFADRVPFVLNPLTRGPYSDQPLWTSALRHRLIPGTRPDLFAAQKIALLRYQPWMKLSAGLHFVAGPRLARRELFFGHFKYNSDFFRKAQAEVARRQHFNDAEEYRKYLALASEGRAQIHDPDLSLPWTDVPFVRERFQG